MVSLSAEKTTVAVIGGGIAGLSCAQALSRTGRFEPTVFDTGRLRPGGRCSSRLVGDTPNKKDARWNEFASFRYLNRVTTDHAAQILTIPQNGFEDFAKQVQIWVQAGVVKQFPDRAVCDIRNPFDRDTKQHDKSRILLRPLRGRFFHGVGGMGSIPGFMAEELDVHQDVWVSPNGGVRYAKGHWEVQAERQVLEFDKLVIAHNGKCADRLMSKTPARELHELLRVNFAPFVRGDGGKKMTLNSLYSLTIAVEAPSVLSGALPAAFVSGFIKNHPNLRFLSCNSRKHTCQEDFEVWTVLSSARFGKAFKGPQEFLPPELCKQVTGAMLTSLEEALVLETGSLLGGCVLESRLQLWGAAVPLNTWVSADDESGGFLYDAKHGVGVCGDWLLDASIAGAWTSGQRLAQHMQLHQHESAGLQGKFQGSVAAEKVGIGSL